MACENLSKGRLNPCKTVGGLKNIYFVNFDSAVYAAMTQDADEQITAFATVQTLYKYELRGAQSIDEANENNADSGSSFWTATGTVTLKAQDLATRKELKLMSYGRPMVITEDFNGIFKLFGSQNGCDVAVNTASGAAMGDFNGYNLTITATEKEPAFFVDPTIIGDTINSTVTEGV